MDVVSAILYFFAQHWLIEVILVISGIFGLLTATFSLFSFLGDHPAKRWATELPSVESETFLSVLSRLVNVPAERGEAIKILNNGDEFWPALFAAMESAQKTINFTVYIWEPGKISDKIFDVLIKKAAAGVEVRILLDGIAGARTPLDRIAELEKVGGLVARFRAPRFGVLTRLHRRNHRRAIVIDGTTGFTGGMAVGDQWLGNANKPDEWRDMMFRVSGNMAQSLQGAFAQLWAGASGEILAGEKFYPKTAASDYPSKYISIASSPSADTQPLPRFYWFSISAAKKTIYLIYPYVVPDKYIRNALAERAKAGVDVRILSPSHRIDAQPIRWAYHSYYDAFLQSGIRIYEYQPAKLHSKAIIIDGKWSIIGSANMDIRSKEFNEENVLGVLDASFASDLEKIFFSDLKHAEEVRLGKWKKRGMFIRVFERLFLAFIKQY